MNISEDVGSKYRYIILARQRVTQLQKGAEPRIDGMDREKNTTIALAELEKGLLNFEKLHIEDEDGDSLTESLMPPIDPSLNESSDKAAGA